MRLIKKIFFLFILAIIAHGKNDISIQKLKQNIERVDQSIKITKEKVKSSKDVEFLPDIYFSLAELYIEKARFMYAMKLEQKSNTPIEEIDFTAEKRVKQEAIETLESLLDRYPKYLNRDRVLFAIAHEYKEMNEGNKSLKYYKEIVDKYPESTYWSESQFNIGMIFFDKKDYEFAKQQFKKILAKEKSAFHPQAFYKIGQCEIFLDKYLESMIAFENAVKLNTKYLKIKEIFKGQDIKDIREEALIASVVPLTDLLPQDLAQNPRFLNVITYYRNLSYDQPSFRRVLLRLGRRLNVKARYVEATQVNYELMRLASESQLKKDAFEGFYLSMKQSKKDYFPESLAYEMEQSFRMFRLENLNYQKYEPAFRDIVTKLHKNSNASNRVEDFKFVTQLYESYISFFPKSKYIADMKVNLAEAYFKSENYIETSKLYFELTKKTKEKAKLKDYFQSALQSLEKAFENIHLLPVLEKFQVRIKYREIAKEYLKNFSERSEQIRVLFNLAKTYYDEKNFDQAVKNFRDFLYKFPNEAQSSQAVLLLLDTYYIRDDLKGLVSEGNQLLKSIPFQTNVKNKIIGLVQQAQLKNVKSLAGDFGSKNYAQDIIRFAKSNKNSALGESALLEAFTSLKAQNDEKAFEVGEDFIASFPKSEKVKEILLTMTQMGMVSVDMKRAQRYLIAYAQKFPEDQQSQNYMQQASLIAEQRGDFEEASRIYEATGNSERKAKILFQNQSWQSLQELSSRLSGNSGIYFSGLSLYRLGKINEGLNQLRRLQNVSATDIETKNQIAHSNYILAYEDYRQFKNIGMGVSFTPQVLKTKIQGFLEVDKQLQTIINMAIGRWALAALYLGGKLNLEMVSYLKQVAPPPGMSPVQLSKVIEPQIKKYSEAAKNLFSQCLISGEENDIFTLFVEGCRQQGQTLVSEEKDLLKKVIGGRNSGKLDESISKIRKQIYKDPRNVKPISMLVKEQVSKGNYFEALATLTRLQEIEPNNQTWKAEMGVVNLYINNLDEAFTFFNEAYAKDSQNKTAIWGLKALYKKFNYLNKLKVFTSKSQSVGKPDGLTHPWMGQ